MTMEILLRAAVLLCICVGCTEAGGNLKVLNKEQFLCNPFSDRDVNPWIRKTYSVHESGSFQYQAVGTGSTKAPGLVVPAALTEKFRSWDQLLHHQACMSTDLDMNKPTCKESKRILLENGEEKEKFDREYKAVHDQLKQVVEAKPRSVNTFVSANIQLNDKQMIDKGVGNCIMTTSIGSKTVDMPFMQKRGFSGGFTEKMISVRVYFAKMTVCKTAQQSFGEGLGEGRNYRRKHTRKHTKEPQPKTINKCAVEQTLLGVYGCLSKGKENIMVTCPPLVKRAMASFM